MTGPANESTEAHLRQLRGFVHDYAKSALQSILLLNGGAVVALLAFGGSIWSSNPESATAEGLAITILIFAAGVLTAIFSMCIAVSSQFQYYENARLVLANEAKEESERTEIDKKLIGKTKDRWELHLALGGLFAFSSYFLFFCGAGRSFVWIISLES